MSFLDKLKAAVTGAKEDPAISKVEGGDALVAALEKHFEPFVAALDEAATKAQEPAAKPKNEGAAQPAEPVATTTEGQPVETEEQKKKREEEEAAKKQAEDAEIENKKKIETLEAELTKLRNDLAAKVTAPAGTNAASNKGAARARIEYAD